MAIKKQNLIGSLVHVKYASSDNLLELSYLTLILYFFL